MATFFIPVQILHRFYVGFPLSAWFCIWLWMDAMLNNCSTNRLLSQSCALFRKSIQCQCQWNYWLLLIRSRFPGMGGHLITPIATGSCSMHHVTTGCFYNPSCVDPQSPHCPFFIFIYCKQVVIMTIFECNNPLPSSSLSSQSEAAAWYLSLCNSPQQNCFVQIDKMCGFCFHSINGEF